MKKTKQGLIWQIICIVVCVLFIPIIVFNLILTLKGTLNNEKLPTLFGYAPTAVVSGSMSPEFEVNDLIFIKSVDTETLKAQEDVICFIDKDGDFITHRIERIEEVDGVKHFYTKGDANNTEDTYYIFAEQIQGKYVGKIANLGGVVMFLQSPSGLILTVILLLMLYIAGELLIEYIEKKKENIKLTDENEVLKAENERLKGLLNNSAQDDSATTVVEEAENTNPLAVPVIVTDADDEEDDDGEGDEDGAVGIVVVENGLNINYRYRRSFMSRLIQSGEAAQDLYTKIKNHLLKYEGVKCRTSWGCETFASKRKPIAKLAVRGKTLFVYLALTDEEIETLRIDEKVDSTKYSAVPAKIRISGVVKQNRALKAIDVICARLGLVVGEKPTETYSYPYETDEQLLEKGLIKLVKGEFVPPVVNTDVPEEIDDGKGDSEVIIPVVVADDNSSDAVAPVHVDTDDDDNSGAVIVPVPVDSADDDSSDAVVVPKGDKAPAPVGRMVVTLTPDMMKPAVTRKPRIKEVQVVDFSDEELPEDMKPYTRAQYLALSRIGKKKVKTLIRHVDEGLYDEDTPSNIKKRQIAELWRKATLPTNTRTLKIVEVKIGQKK